MSPEQKARELLDRMGIEGALDMTAGDVGELANLIAERDHLHTAAAQALAALIRAEANRTAARDCDEFSGESPSFWAGMEHAATIIEKT